jgi:hypothetical protein
MKFDVIKDDRLKPGDLCVDTEFPILFWPQQLGGFSIGSVESGTFIIILGCLEVGNYLAACAKYVGVIYVTNRLTFSRAHG